MKAGRAESVAPPGPKRHVFVSLGAPVFALHSVVEEALLHPLTSCSSCQSSISISP
jgi:hypothetical protein